MRRCFIPSLIFLAVLISAQTDKNKLNDLNKVYQNMKRNYKVQESEDKLNITDWETKLEPGFRVKMKFPDKAKHGAPVLLYASLNETDFILFGMLLGEPPLEIYALDLDGNGKIDGTFDHIILPYWIGGEFDSNKKPSAKLTKIFDRWMELYQSDGGAEGYKGDLNDLDAELYSVLKSQTEPSRSLFFLYYDYKLNADFLEYRIVILGFMDLLYLARYGKPHPLIKYYLIESYLLTGKYFYAQKYLNELLKLSPDFIPARIYECLNESDDKIKAVKISQLKKEHPRHWMVIQELGSENGNAGSEKNDSKSGS